MKFLSHVVVSLLAAAPAQAGELGNYVLKAYVMASIETRFIKGCDKAETCPVPANVRLVECTFASGRFGFQNAENEGELVCLQDTGVKPYAEIKKLFLNLRAGSIELTNAKMKFQTFRDWASLKVGTESIGVHEVSLSETGAIRVDKVTALKNIVWDGGIQNGITLNVYFTDLLIRGDEAARTVLKLHCGRRAKHVRAAFSLVEAKVAVRLEPFLAALENGCQFK